MPRLAAFSLICLFAAPALAEPPPAAELVSINTHEHFFLRPDPKGKFGKKQLRGWTRFTRCWHTGRMHAMAPRLASLIYETAKHFDFALIHFYDGYRAPRVAREKGNTRSPHKRGLAADFQIEGVDNKTLRDYLYTTFDKVGVGYYPNSTFVHLDVRPKGRAFWVDNSYPGQRQSKGFYSKKSFEQQKADEAVLDAAKAALEDGGAPTDNDKPAAATTATATTATTTTTSAAPAALAAPGPQVSSSPGANAPNPPAVIRATP